MIRPAVSSFIAVSRPRGSPRLPLLLIPSSRCAACPPPGTAGTGAEPGTVAPLVERVKGAVVTIQSTKFIRRFAVEDPWTRMMREQFGGPARTRPAREAGGAGLGLHHRQVGHRADQQPRRRRRGRGDRPASRQPPLRRARAGQRSADGRRGRAHRQAARRPADGDAGRFGQGAGGRLRAGDRQPARPRPDRHDGHRQREEPRHRREAGRNRSPLRGLHPDRRRHQPGQLGRAAVQFSRRGDRHQRRHHQPGRGDERRLRHPDQPGAPDRRPDPQVRKGRARVPRRQRRGLHARARGRDARAVRGRVRSSTRSGGGRRRRRPGCGPTTSWSSARASRSTATGA